MERTTIAHREAVRGQQSATVGIGTGPLDDDDMYVWALGEARPAR